MSDFYSNLPPSTDDRRRVHHLYNPYESLNTSDAAAAPAPIHRIIYDLPTSPEILFDEEAAHHRRSWGHNLSFYAGSGYLAGAAVGAVRGAISGIRMAEPGDSAKIRVNRVLNSSGQAGKKFGNSVGVLGLVFAGLESAIYAATGSDGVWSTVAAGLGTGAVYRAASGPRSAAVAGAIGGIVAGMAVAGKQAMKRYAPI